MQRCTSAPASAHLASVAPQPNSMSSGCAPIASTRRGHGEIDADGHGVVVPRSRRPSASRSAASSTSKPSARSRTMRTSRPQRSASATWRAHEPGPYANAKSAAARDREHRIAVVVVVGNDHRDRRVAVVGDAVERRRERQIGVHHDDAARGRGRAPTRGRRARRRRAMPGSAMCATPSALAHAITSGALDTITTGRAPGRGDDALGHRARERAARVVVECVREAGLAQCERSQRDDDACGVGKAPGRHGLRMLPSVDPVYSVAKGVFWPWLRWGLHWTIEGAQHIPTTGPGRAREQPRVVPRSADARVGRRSAAAATCASSPRPSCSTSRCSGTLLRAAHQIPVRRGRVDAADALQAAVDALGRGRVRRACSPRARSPRTSSRWSASRAPRGSRSRAGVAITPVGLWGTHRILTKGRKPHWQWGVAQTAVVGEPIVPRPDEHVKQTTDRMMAAIVECVARRASSIPRPRRGRRAVVVARSGHRRRAPEDRVTRVAVVGAGSWGTAVAAIVAGNAPTVLWARRAELADEHRRRPREPRLPARHRAARRSCARPPISRRRAPAPTWWCSRCRRTGCARCSPTARAARRAGRGDREPGQGHRAGHAAAHDRGDRRGARRSRPGPHRRAHRTEPRARGRGRPADGVGGRGARRGGRRRAPSACSSRRRCASTRTPTWSAARWRAR